MHLLEMSLRGFTRYVLCVLSWCDIIIQSERCQVSFLECHGITEMRLWGFSRMFCNNFCANVDTMLWFNQGGLSISFGLQFSVYHETLNKTSYLAQKSDVACVSCHFKSPASQLFVQQLVQNNKKDNNKAPHYWHFVPNDTKYRINPIISDTLAFSSIKFDRKWLWRLSLQCVWTLNILILATFLRGTMPWFMISTISC